MAVTDRQTAAARVMPACVVFLILAWGPLRSSVEPEEIDGVGRKVVPANSAATFPGLLSRSAALGAGVGGRRSLSASSTGHTDGHEDPGLGGEHASHGEHEAHGEDEGNETHEGDHHHRHPHHHHHEEVTPMMFAIATLLWGFICATVGMLYLVNFPDPNIRSYIYKMLSSTMSIFLAVTINVAIFSFWLEQVLPSPWPRGLNIKHIGTWGRLGVGLALFVTFFALINVASYHTRNRKVPLYATRVISGHITAFAGITAFGTLQYEAHESEALQKHHEGVFFFSIIWLTSFSMLSRQIRIRLFGAYKDPSTYTSVTNENQPEEQEWRVDVCEAEDDATALIISFLASQVMIWKATGTMLPVHGGGENIKNLAMGFMLLPITCCVILLILFTCVRKTFKIKESDPTSWQVRLVHGVQTFFAMCMSWCALRLGVWRVQLALHNTVLDSHAMAQVVNAFALTLISIAIIIVLDHFSDNISRVDQEMKAAQDQDKPRLKPSNTTNLRSDGLLAAAAGLNADAAAAELNAHLARSRRHLSDVSNLEKGLRTVIDSFGLLVGLCWEKACDAGIETIIEGNEALLTHRVVSKIFAAAVVIMLMLPAWLWYVVPKANKTVEQFTSSIELEKIQAGNAGSSEEQRFAIEVCDKLDIDSMKVVLEALTTSIKIKNEGPQG